MSDFLVELGANPTASNLIKRLGLPLPMPQRLDRGKGPWPERPLEGRTVVVGAAVDQVQCFDVLAPALAEAGAAPFVQGPTGGAWSAAAEAWGRPVTPLEPGACPEGRIDALVFDATGAATVDDLRALFHFVQPRIGQLAKHGRVVLIGRDPAETTSLATGAARRSLLGFVKSLAKEIGGKGATANVITVAKGREAALAPTLRWLLSPRSAFVTGQELALRSKVKAPTTVPTTRPLEGKVVLVTGAARGIGEATAQALSREGAHVLCLDRPADAEPLAAVARAVGGTPVLADVTAPDAAATILAAAEAQGGLDVIVHNAGVTRDKTLAKMDDARWDLTLDINLRAVLELTEALAPHLREGGRVIALSSVAGIAGNFGQVNYTTSKAGVIGFVETAAPKLAKQGITVNGIAPGFIETRLTAAIPVATREAGRRLSALAQGGQPIDIAEAVTFLATPGSWGLSGTVLRVCGGAFLGA
ncbi:MAG: 3-oxoacyl-ACP reductase [Alphaproteobacteria bacterium]|nr:3-oxoacyl-ACP reductase [Alphaproteobacteria bacterium]